jgi:hypothetical protein
VSFVEGRGNVIVTYPGSDPNAGVVSFVGAHMVGVARARALCGFRFAGFGPKVDLLQCEPLLHAGCEPTKHKVCHHTHGVQVLPLALACVLYTSHTLQSRVLANRLPASHRTW